MSSRLVSVITVLIVALVLRFFYFFQHIPQYFSGQEVKLQVVLMDNPVISNRGQKFIVKTEGNQRISIQTNLKELYQYGNSLAITGTLQVQKDTSGREFLNLYYPEITKQSEASNPLLKISSWLRKESSALFEGTLPATSANLLLGIVFGIKGDFPKDFLTDLQSAGVLHVIAASGMNVSFFTGAVMFSLSAFLQRRIALILAISAAIFYSFLVGFEASILRATIMAIIAFTANFFGRQMFSVLALLGTGYLMLLWSPTFLWDVGFQLSFMATLGILVIKPFLTSWEKIKGIGEDLTTTFSAQLTTLPILLGTFGKIGIFGILVNLLILWTVPILMLLGSLAVILGLIFAPLGKVLLLLCLPFLVFFEEVVRFFGGLGWNINIENLPWQIEVSYYLLLGAIIMTLGKRLNGKV